MNIRKAHVKRFFSAEKTSWVDVLRLDEFELDGSVIDGVRGQKRTVSIAWDDVNSEASEPDRTYEQITIDSYSGGEVLLGGPVQLNVIKTMTFYLDDQRIDWVFNNSDNTTRSYTEIGIPTVVTEEPFIFSGVKSWDAYRSYQNAHGTPSVWGTGINIRLIDMIEQIMPSPYQRSTTTFNQEDVTNYIGGGGATYQQTVMLDPFQIIVNACWESVAEELLELSVGFTWWGEEPVAVRCGTDEFIEHMALHDSSPLGNFAWHSYNFFSTKGALKPSHYHGANEQGVISVGGEPPDAGLYEYTGIPSYTMSIGTPAVRVAWLNLDTWYADVTDPIVPEWNIMARIYIDGLTATFAQRAQNPIFGKWCDFVFTLAPKGGVHQDLDVRALGSKGNDTIEKDYSTEWRDQFSYEIGRKTMNFSGVRVRRISDGQVFVADSIAQVTLDISDPWGVTIFLKPAKKEE